MVWTIILAIGNQPCNAATTLGCSSTLRGAGKVPSVTVDPRLVFLEGKFVLLRVPTPEDVESTGWLSWLNSATNTTYSQHHAFPVTPGQQLRFVDDCNSESKLQLAIVDRADESSLCGMVSLNDINLVHRRAEISGLQDVAKTRHNPAIFLESWALVLRHGFEQLGLESIYGGTFHPQVVAALERGFNFEVEGVRRRHVYKDGLFHDVTLIAVRRDTVQYPVF